MTLDLTREALPDLIAGTEALEEAARLMRQRSRDALRWTDYQNWGNVVSDAQSLVVSLEKCLAALQEPVLPRIEEGDPS